MPISRPPSQQRVQPVTYAEVANFGRATSPALEAVISELTHEQQRQVRGPRLLHLLSICMLLTALSGGTAWYLLNYVLPMY